MIDRPSILCPIDFSDGSRAAFAHAIAIADQFGARVVVVTVDDPLLAAVASESGRLDDDAMDTGHELRRFCQETLDAVPSGARSLEFRVAVGKPAPEILRVASEVGAELIVMSSRGRSGMKKVFFGSTAERVLRETTVPVLVTSDQRVRSTSLAGLARNVARVIAPVDFTSTSSHQVAVASAIASALSVPLLLTHVIEPVFVPASVRFMLPGSEAARRADVEERLRRLAGSSMSGASPELIVLTGDPSEEIVKLAAARDANLIVTSLHLSEPLGRHIGSVTYRILCLTSALVLALPPAHDAVGAEPEQLATVVPS